MPLDLVPASVQDKPKEPTMSEKPEELQRNTPPNGVLNPPETEIVHSARVACDGGILGHPRVWLQIPLDQGWVECGYCDKRFVLEGDGGH